MIYVYINHNENVWHYNIFCDEYLFQKSVSSVDTLFCTHFFIFITEILIIPAYAVSAAKRLLLINIFVRDRLSYEFYNVDVAHGSADGYSCQVHDAVAGDVDLVINICGVVAHEALHVIARLL